MRKNLCLSSVLFISGPLSRSSFFFLLPKNFSLFFIPFVCLFLFRTKTTFLFSNVVSSILTTFQIHFLFLSLSLSLFSSFVSSSYSLFIFQISFYCMGFFSFFLCHFSRSCSFHSFFSFSFPIGFSFLFDITLFDSLSPFFSTPFLIFLCSSRSPFSSISCFIPLFFCLFSLFCFLISFFCPSLSHFALLPALSLSIILVFLDLHHVFFVFIAFFLNSLILGWRILICHFFLHLSFGRRAFDIKISLWEYFLCTSLPLYCPSSFSLFSVCAIFCVCFSFFSPFFYRCFLVL